MKIKNLFIVPTLLLALTGAVACGNSKKADSTDATEKKVIIKAPDFNADSAYTYVKAQTDFGPRVPNTQAHRDCGAYLATIIQSLMSLGLLTTRQRRLTIACKCPYRSTVR